MFEYCSKGDLRQYLIKNRRGFETSLKDYKDTGVVKINEQYDTDGAPSNVIKLYQWAFQVKYLKQTYKYLEYSINNENGKIKFFLIMISSWDVLDCRWNGVFDK